MTNPILATPTPPVNSVTGDIYFDTTSMVLHRYDGTSWVALAGSPQSSPWDDLVTEYGRSRVGAAAKAMIEAEIMAEDNDLIRHYLDRLRVAIKMVRE